MKKIIIILILILAGCKSPVTTDTTNVHTDTTGIHSDQTIINRIK